MNFVIITHVLHHQDNNFLLGYGPYIREMNIWINYANSVTIVAPLTQKKAGKIDLNYEHSNITFSKIPIITLTTPLNALKSFLFLPLISFKIWTAMKNADHIHLRCPGNVGLIGCLVQILFPNKIKTAKYAGNWDPKSRQPWSYRLQKWILNNTFLTRNMQVLVYGKWNNQSKNIKSFFTATYSDSEKEIIQKNSLVSNIDLIFVGSLTEGKNPMYAIKLVEKLAKKDIKIVLNIFGEGSERISLKKYIQDHNLQNIIYIHGNQNKEIVKEAYKKSHFVVLPSKSEGWPKAIAEGMFWGCVPLATNVSCVAYMLDYGQRGILLDMDLEKDILQIEKLISNENFYTDKSQLAVQWSQNYTTDIFEKEIEKLLTK